MPVDAEGGMAQFRHMLRDPMSVIDDIEAVRARNNKNWMDLLRLAYKCAPAEATEILKSILVQDEEISRLAKEVID